MSPTLASRAFVQILCWLIASSRQAVIYRLNIAISCRAAALGNQRSLIALAARVSSLIDPRSRLRKSIGR
jgi:hypothetical protein